MGVVYLKIFDREDRENGYYIGITNDFKSRMNGHNSYAYTRKSQLPVYRAMRKYNHKTEILAEIDDYDLLKQMEIEAIKLFREYGMRLYNLTDGGDGTVGVKLSKEVIERRASKLRGKKRDPEIIKKIATANTGKKRTLEVRLKLSNIHKGKVIPRDIVEKIRQKNIGKTRSDEFKQKVRERLLGVSLSEEHKLHISQSHKGKKLSEEHKLKIKNSNKGRKPTELNIKMRTLGWKKYYENGVKLSEEHKNNIKIGMKKTQKYGIEHHSTKPINYYEDKPIRKYDFKCKCKKLNYNFEDFEEIFAFKRNGYNLYYYKYKGGLDE